MTARKDMDIDQEQLVNLLKQVAEGVLNQKIIIQDLKARIERLEHVATVTAPTTIPFNSASPISAMPETIPSGKDIFYAQRDVIESQR